VNLSRTGLGDSDFCVLEGAAPQGTVAGQYDWSQSMVTMLLRLLKKLGKGGDDESQLNGDFDGRRGPPSA
jgi:hypothetical protein